MDRRYQPPATATRRPAACPTRPWRGGVPPRARSGAADRLPDGTVTCCGNREVVTGRGGNVWRMSPARRLAALVIAAIAALAVAVVAAPTVAADTDTTNGAPLTCNTNPD